MKKPKSMTIFANGNVAVFSAGGEQMPELQQNIILMYFEWLESHGVNAVEIPFVNAMTDGREYRQIWAVKNDDGSWNYESDRS